MREIPVISERRGPKNQPDGWEQGPAADALTDWRISTDSDRNRGKTEDLSTATQARAVGTGLGFYRLSVWIRSGLMPPKGKARAKARGNTDGAVDAIIASWGGCIAMRLGYCMREPLGGDASVGTVYGGCRLADPVVSTVRIR